MRRHALLAACLLLLARPVLGQIVMPEQVQPFEPIVASYSLAEGIPPDCDIQGGWSCETARWLVVTPRTIHIWAKPGRHRLNFRGAWVKTQPITLPDGTVIQAFIGFGFLDDSVEFTVGTPSPEPEPPGPDPPIPPQPKAGVIVEESSQRTPSQAKLWSEVAQSLPNVYLLDQDQLSGPLWSKIAQAVHEANLPLPVLVTVGSDANVLRVVRCPATVDAVKKELAK